VPYRSEIERMSVRRAPLPVSAPKSEAAQVYTALWAEVRGRIDPPGSALPLHGGARPGAAAVGPEQPELASS
jgi:hypothetical protein